MQLHNPVLLKEVVELLNVKKDQWIIDATFGRGGHTKAILEHGGQVVAIDCDEEAIHFARRQFIRALEQKKLILVRENFEQLLTIVAGLEETVKSSIGGVLADFGVSSPQFDTPERGFSFQADGPLDMRMDDRLSVSAKEIVNGLGKRELYELLTTYGGEQHARVIVEAILLSRREKPITTTAQLAKIIEKAVRRQGHLHPATKTFMAIRMLVNDELGVIERFLPHAVEVLIPTGRLVTISFHEGEDRLVKQFIKDQEESGKVRNLTEKPMMATDEEVERNVRSRSAKLRALEKL